MIKRIENEKTKTQWFATKAPHCALRLKHNNRLEALSNYLMSFQNAAFKRQAIKLNTPRNSSTQTPSWVR